jgi:hypothetical protein
MAIDKEQYPRNSYSDEDRKLIISLLNEYAEKLLNICEEIDKQQRFLTVSLLIYSLVIFIYFHLFYHFIDNTTATRSLIIIPIVFCTFMIYMYFGIQKLGLLKRNARIISTRLEKVIRVASQLQEHILIDFAARLELALRLSDAEWALQNYTNLINRKLFRLF